MILIQNLECHARQRYNTTRTAAPRETLSWSVKWAGFQKKPVM